MNMKYAMRMAALVAVVLIATGESEALAIPNRHLDKRDIVSSMASLYGKAVGWAKAPFAGAAAAADDGARAASVAAGAADDSVKAATQGAAGTDAVAGDSVTAATQGAAGTADESLKAASQRAADDLTVEEIVQGLKLTKMKVNKDADGAITGAEFTNPSAKRNEALQLAAGAAAGAGLIGGLSHIPLRPAHPETTPSNGTNGEGQETNSGSPAPSEPPAAPPAELPAAPPAAPPAEFPTDPLDPSRVIDPLDPSRVIDLKDIQRDVKTGLYFVRNVINDGYSVYDSVVKSWTDYCPAAKGSVEYTPCPDGPKPASTTGAPTVA